MVCRTTLHSWIRISDVLRMQHASPYGVRLLPSKRQSTAFLVTSPLSLRITHNVSSIGCLKPPFCQISAARLTMPLSFLWAGPGPAARWLRFFDPRRIRICIPLCAPNAINNRQMVARPLVLCPIVSFLWHHGISRSKSVIFGM
jgi:hypothetical protein